MGFSGVIEYPDSAAKDSEWRWSPERRQWEKPSRRPITEKQAAAMGILGFRRATPTTDRLLHLPGYRWIVDATGHGYHERIDGPVKHVNCRVNLGHPDCNCGARLGDRRKG
jgi:hypothetical protein